MTCRDVCVVCNEAVGDCGTYCKNCHVVLCEDCVSEADPDECIDIKVGDGWDDRALKTSFFISNCKKIFIQQQKDKQLDFSKDDFTVEYLTDGLFEKNPCDIEADGEDSSCDSDGEDSDTDTDKYSESDADEIKPDSVVDFFNNTRKYLCGPRNKQEKKKYRATNEYYLEKVDLYDFIEEPFFICRMCYLYPHIDVNYI